MPGVSETGKGILMSAVCIDKIVYLSKKEHSSIIKYFEFLDLHVTLSKALYYKEDD